MYHIFKTIGFLVFLSGLIFFKAFSGVSSDTSIGYEISIRFKPYKNCTVFLAHYYGEQILVDATATLDEAGRAVFKGPSKLHEGIYLVYEETNRGTVDFLIDSNQQFTVEVEFGDTYQAINFQHSAENDLLKGYKQFMAYKEVDILNYQERLVAATNKADSNFYTRQLERIDDSIQLYRQDLIAKNPGIFLSTLLMAMKEPVLPEQLRNPVSSADSLAGKYFIKAHYWDGVKFWDDRLLYTPFFHTKIEKYFYKVVEWKADSAIKQIDWMMSTAIASGEMTHHILEKLFFGAMYHRFKWEDAVYIHLFEKYLADKSYSWLSAEDRDKLTKHAFLLMANNSGRKAYDIHLTGIDGKQESLFSIKAKYTLVCFWDATCSHCLEILPVLDSFYQANWKKKGLKIYAVSVESEGTRETWSTYIKDHRLEGWTNVYHPAAEEKDMAEKGELSTLRSYNVWYYPSFYLLDKDKRFMAKKLSYPQIAELINSIVGK